MPSRLLLLLASVVPLAAAPGRPPAPLPAAPQIEPAVRIASGTPGLEVPVRGVILVAGQAMQVVERTTPFEFRPASRLVFAAFEPADRAESPAILRLELVTEHPDLAVVTAPRVMVGRRVGGVASDFVQGY
jgi:hypothetical protein